MTSAIDYGLYVITDAALCAETGLVETARAAVAGGAGIIQLRDPDADTRELVAQARALLQALRPLGIPLIINDRIDVCLVAEADGVHLGQDDMRAKDARHLLGAGKLLGLSIGSPEEYQASKADLEFVDYVGIGPVASTRSKSDAGSAIGIEGFGRVRRLIDKPAVAIGGVGLGHIPDLVAAGADGVAVISAVCGQPDPEASAAALSRAVRGARA